MKLDQTQARQGSFGKPVLWVLIASLVIGIAAMLGIELFGPAADYAPGAGQVPAAQTNPN